MKPILFLLACMIIHVADVSAACHNEVPGSGTSKSTTTKGASTASVKPEAPTSFKATTTTTQSTTKSTSSSTPTTKTTKTSTAVPSTASTRKEATPTTTTTSTTPSTPSTTTKTTTTGSASTSSSASTGPTAPVPQVTGGPVTFSTSTVPTSTPTTTTSTTAAPTTSTTNQKPTSTSAKPTSLASKSTTASTTTTTSTTAAPTTSTSTQKPTSTSTKPTSTKSTALPNGDCDGYPAHCPRECGCPVYTIDGPWAMEHYNDDMDLEGEMRKVELIWNDTTCIPTGGECNSNEKKMDIGIQLKGAPLLLPVAAKGDFKYSPRECNKTSGEYIVDSNTIWWGCREQYPLTTTEAAVMNP